MRAGNTEVAVYACTCRNMMTNFVNLLHNYFMLEAIEHNFDKFQQHLQSVPDMDKLIEATDELTESMKEKFFITDRYKKVYKYLEDIYKKIEHFISLLKEVEYGISGDTNLIDLNQLYEGYINTMVKFVEYL